MFTEHNSIKLGINDEIIEGTSRYLEIKQHTFNESKKISQRNQNHFSLNKKEHTFMKMPVQ